MIEPSASIRGALNDEAAPREAIHGADFVLRRSMTNQNTGARAPNAQPVTFERGDHTELGEYLVSNGPPMVTAEGEIWAYDAARGVWVSGIEKTLRRRVKALAGSPIITTTGTRRALHVNVASARGAIEMLRDETEDPAFFASSAPGLACANGLVRLNGIVSHAPENRARVFYPYDFDANASAPRWERFLNDLFRDDEDKADKSALRALDPL
jgi:hypothetical protein